MHSDIQWILKVLSDNNEKISTLDLNVTQFPEWE